MYREIKMTILKDINDMFKFVDQYKEFDSDILFFVKGEGTASLSFFLYVNLESLKNSKQLGILEMG